MKLIIELALLCYHLQLFATGFRIIMEKAESEILDPTVFSEFNYIVRKYNRTQSIMNGTYTLLQPIERTPGDRMRISLFQMKSNAYKPIAFKIDASFCDLIDNKAITGEVWKTSNMPEKCPILAGDYYIINFQFAETHKVGFNLKGKFKAVTELIKSNKLAARVAIYITCGD